MGDNHPDPGRPGVGTGNLGLCWIAGMASARIVSPPDHSVHHSGRLRVKPSLLLKLSRNPPKRKDRPLGRSFRMIWNSLYLSLAFGFKEISDFG
jgi:hypothetical protein